MTTLKVRSLFRLLENNFSPLGMTKQACAVLEKIEKPEYAQYMDAIKYGLFSPSTLFHHLL